jgi:hypothetical protein
MNPHAIPRRFRPLWFAAAVIFLAAAAHAERWTLVDFGTDDASTVMPHGDWSVLLRHPERTRYVNPDGNAQHWGITETDGLGEQQWAYYGVRGSTPISFRKGHSIIATFYNNSNDYAFLEPRISFSDADAPDPADPERTWFTMQNRFYKVDAGWMPPHELVEMEYYITDAGCVSSLNRIPSAGDHTLVNISKMFNDTRFILTRIELTDEADITSPTLPGNLAIALAETTAGAGDNLVKLTWTASTDPGPHATGISRYLIYRDGALYDHLAEDDVALQGENLHYVDLCVEPNTRYNYTVTALDNAPYGLYPMGERVNTRVGNESPHAGPVSIVTGPWRSSRLIAPGEGFRYLGAFRMPPDMDEYWGYASGGLAYYPSGNPGADPSAEWAGSLFAYTLLQREIAELSIPIPVQSANVEELPRARTLRTPVDIWPRVYGGADPTVPPGGTDYKVAGLAYHPAANGVAERLYYGTCNFYGSDGSVPSHGWFSLDLTQSGGAWHLGAAPPGNIYPGLVAKIAFAAPPAWAAAHTGGRTLIVGDTFLSGGEVIACGPSLYAIAPWESGQLPANGGVVSAVNLVRYSNLPELSNRVVNFTRDEMGEGGAWLEAGTQSAVAISYRRAVGDTWYGDALGNLHATWDIPEPPMGDKGVCATRWRTGLMLYNPDDLAAVAAGTRPSHSPQPYAVFDFSRFSLRTDGGTGYAGAVAYDSATHRLFYIEHNGDPGYEYGYALIHVWEVRSVEPPAGATPQGWIAR